MSKTPLGTVRVGEATVTIMNTVELRHPLRDSLQLPESAWKDRYDHALFGDWIPVPVQNALIQTDELTLLVDAPSADLGEETDLVIPGYAPPPSLIKQLAELGVSPEEVTHIVITHTHYDHYNGLSARREGRSVPLYPNARLLIGRADWEKEAQSPEFVPGGSLYAQMLLPYEEAGHLQLVDDAVHLDGVVSVLPSPSETKGHLSVRVQSQGKTLYCVGDVYHHWVEVENRDWMVGWVADREMTIAERARLEETALAEDAMLMASHIHGVGRLKRAGDGVRWQDLELPG